MATRTMTLNPRAAIVKPNTVEQPTGIDFTKVDVVRFLDLALAMSRIFTTASGAMASGDTFEITIQCDGTTD